MVFRRKELANGQAHCFTFDGALCRKIIVLVTEASQRCLGDD